MQGSSVACELVLIRGVLETARREWGRLRENPAKDVRKPASPPSRKRRITQPEIDAIVSALGYDGGVPANAAQRIALSFLFAIETAMRSGEICGLTWADVGTKSVRLPKTKNGDARSVLLSTSARSILALLPRDGDQVFALGDATRDVLFRRARDQTEIVDMHFHDTRAEAIWRLSKRLDVMELAKMIGHRDLRSLMIYYATSADDLADLLG